MGSYLNAAGRFAEVTGGDRESLYYLWTSDNFGVPGWDPVAGDWFIFDYEAQKAGSCDVVLCSYKEVGYEKFVETPVETLSFTHVPSRDFNNDDVVNMKDYAMLSSRWGTASDSDPNKPDTEFDLNSDQQIDALDLVLFNEYWLEQTDCIGSIPDQNDLQALP